MEIRMNVPVMSVNTAYQGRRFKTDKYKVYEKMLLFTLPRLTVPPAPYKVYYEFGMSNTLSDFDNPIKPLQDILQTKYGFNDRDIMEANVKKVKVKKGDEYFVFKMETILK